MNVAVFGGFGKAPLAPGWRRETALALLGGGDLDLGATAPAEGARLTAIAVFGGVDVRVPPGTRIAMSGLSLFGGREVKMPAGDGPTIRVRAVAVFGGVTIRPSEASAAVSPPAS
jgi:hypothetical protein